MTLQRVCSCNDDDVAAQLAALIDRRTDTGEVFLLRDELLALQVAAALVDDLVFQVQSGDAGDVVLLDRTCYSKRSCEE